MSATLVLKSPVALLYVLCAALLAGMALLVVLRGWRRSAAHAVTSGNRLNRAANRYFVLASLSLLLWVVTLFFFHQASDPDTVLTLGRLNFAAALPAAAFGYLLVAALAQTASGPTLHVGLSVRSLQVLTVILTAITAFTPLVDRAELPGIGYRGEPLTQYGPLFPVYLLFIAACLLVSVLLAFRVGRSASSPLRDQLLLVGSGVLATGLVSLVTNAILPYGFGDFRFTDAGALSSVLFLAAVGYAILRHRLFDLRLFLRRTLVYGLLLSLVLAAYSSLIVLVSDKIAGESQGTLTRFGVLVIAFSFDPVRRFLEQKADLLMFRQGRSEVRTRRLR